MILPTTREALDGAARFALSTIILAVVAVVVWRLFMHDMPLSNRDAIMMSIGVLLGLVKDVYGYYFNATASGARKDSTIAAALNATTNAGGNP